MIVAISGADRTVNDQGIEFRSTKEWTRRIYRVLGSAAAAPFWAHATVTPQNRPTSRGQANFCIDSLSIGSLAHDWIESPPTVQRQAKQSVEAMDGILVDAVTWKSVTKRARTWTLTSNDCRLMQSERALIGRQDHCPSLRCPPDIHGFLDPINAQEGKSF